MRLDENLNFMIAFPYKILNDNRLVFRNILKLSIKKPIIKIRSRELTSLIVNI